jgi:predicted oxidoreductase
MTTMSLTTLCERGPEISSVVCGAWRMSEWGWSSTERLRWIEECADLGATTFDHADIYGGYTVEGLFGEALSLKPGIRNRLQLIGKVGIKLVSPLRPDHSVHQYDTSAAHILRSVDNSLAQLRSDHLDLLLIHRPDPLMDADEVAEALARLIQLGKVRAVGVSNFKPSQFALLNDRIRLVTNQVELSPLRLDVLHDGTLDQCQQLRVRPMIWSPLAGGALFTSEEAAAQRVRGVLEDLARQHRTSATSIAYAWIARLPSRPVPIVGSRRIEAVKDAVSAMSIPLSSAEWTRIWEAATGHEVP